MTTSKIQLIVPYYTKPENILPEELIHSEITVELQKAKKEIKKKLKRIWKT
jgi:hypothetical protein